MFALEFINLPEALSALSALLGPVAFFAAPTEDVEALVLDDEPTTQQAEANDVWTGNWDSLQTNAL